MVIHLGDGEVEAQRLKASFPEKMFLQVRGNCDWGSELPVTGLWEFETPGPSQGVPDFLFYGSFIRFVTIPWEVMSKVP